ncbi:MAG: isochorismate synthase [Sphingobium sp.]
MTVRLCFDNVDAVEERVRAFFASPSAGPADILAGALPFDRMGTVLLFRPDHVERREGVLPTAQGVKAQVHAMAEWPGSADYAAMVSAALDRIGAAAEDGLRKVVLARSLRIDMSAPVDPLSIAARLAGDISVTTFLVDLRQRQEDAPRALVGATPELLLLRRGLAVVSHPLAGSAPRTADRAEDRAVAEALLRSEKDRREHALVTEAVFDLLAPHCARLSAPDGMALRSTATMWHLGTRIEGVLKSADAPSAAGLAALLHPTPAVGGDPRDLALDAIRELERHDRGYYAGAVGWVDGRGDGEWHVALRCAEVAGSRLTLHAGAGIVSGSEPEKEVAETAAKFRAMLHALGVDEHGRIVEAVS